MHRLFKRSPAAAFLVLAVGISTAAMLISRYGPPGLAGGLVTTTIAKFGPTLAALIVATAMARGGSAQRVVPSPGELVRRALSWRIHPGWWAVALLGPAVLFAATAVVATGGMPPAFGTPPGGRSASDRAYPEPAHLPWWRPGRGTRLEGRPPSTPRSPLRVREGGPGHRDRGRSLAHACERGGLHRRAYHPDHGLGRHPGLDVLRVGTEPGPLHPRPRRRERVGRRAARCVSVPPGQLASLGGRPLPGLPPFPCFPRSDAPKATPRRLSLLKGHSHEVHRIHRPSVS